MSNVEIAEFAALSELLKEFQLTEEEDSRKWNEGRMNFSVKLAYSIIEEKKMLVYQLGKPVFPCRRIWRNKIVPLKVQFFVWSLVWGRVLTADKLKKRGMIVEGLLVMCKAESETLHHLFLECPVVRICWDFFWIDADHDNFIGVGLLEKALARGRLIAIKK